LPCSDLLAAVREVAAQVVRIFAQPQLALELFLQRIFEQKVQSALERLLQLQPPKAPAAQQQNYLQWVAPPGAGLPGCCWR
jgi:sarcosine oxidase gamma subunit